MTYNLSGLLLCIVIRFIFAKPQKNGLERFEDKNNWTSLGGC